jgi:hypothetical protein
MCALLPNQSMADLLNVSNLTFCEPAHEVPRKPSAFHRRATTKMLSIVRDAGKAHPDTEPDTKFLCFNIRAITKTENFSSEVKTMNWGKPPLFVQNGG